MRVVGVAEPTQRHWLMPWRGDLLENHVFNLVFELLKGGEPVVFDGLVEEITVLFQQRGKAVFNTENVVGPLEEALNQSADVRSRPADVAKPLKGGVARAFVRY